jgi:hypothetical protein
VSSSGEVAQGGRAERNGSGGASAETWFLLDAKAGIRVAVDKARHVASETVAVEVGGRWHGSVDTHNEHGDEAMARV